MFFWHFGFIRFALSNDLDPVDLLVVGTLYLFFFSIFSSIFIEVRDLSEINNMHTLAVPSQWIRRHEWNK